MRGRGAHEGAEAAEAAESNVAEAAVPAVSVVSDDSWTGARNEMLRLPLRSLTAATAVTSTADSKHKLQVPPATAVKGHRVDFSQVDSRSN